jgi:excinuclease ABC subunit C
LIEASVKEATKNSPQIDAGVRVIKDYVATLPEKPGVYRMINFKNEVLYIGKAKSLKKRVASYTLAARLPNRLQRMVSETHSMEFIYTKSEVEALLLEANLIKTILPKYNILLKDSKFFAYLLFTKHTWPQLKKHRGAKTLEGKYYGPFTSTEAVNNTIITLHKIFKLRNCSDSFFNSRQRPCLQYHIKRCSAPCVNYIRKEDYAKSVHQAIAFLEGKSLEIQKDLSDKMHEASEEKQYEKAIVYRDQIRALTQIQSNQSLYPTFSVDTDVIGFAELGGHVCIQVLFLRKGTFYGTKDFFPERTQELEASNILSSFLTLFYEEQEPPLQILLSHPVAEHQLIERAFRSKFERMIALHYPQKGEKHKLVLQASKQAKDALERHIQKHTSSKKILEKIQTLFALPAPLKKIEIYDNSHIMGKHSIGAMVAFNESAFDKSAYRKFTIQGKDIAPGDDYGMMREVLRRRLDPEKVSDRSPPPPFPDLIIVDGGRGQLNVAIKVLAQYGLSIPLIAIAKGPNRNAGNETFFTPHNLEGMTLESHKEVLHFFERLRDEAHRFAIGFHRSKREKALVRSPLDEIDGIGQFRKRLLLQHFGSVKNVESATEDQLMMIAGISASLAKKIYDHFHPD